MTAARVAPVGAPGPVFPSDDVEEHIKSPWEKLTERLVQLLQDIRNWTRLQPYEDVAHGKAPLSLFCLRKENLVRKFCIVSISWRPFDLFMLVVIIANCVTLAMDSNRPGWGQSSQGKGLKIANYIFIGLFSLEAVLKIIGLGFILGPNSYLRDGWNWIDFLTVCASYLEFTSLGNFTAIRSIRVLRPLRTITKIPQMRNIVSTLIRSIPMLADVMMLALFYLSIFGVVAVQLFSGELKGRCAAPDFSHAYTDPATGIIQNVQYVVPDDQADDVCRGPRTSKVVWLNTTGTPTTEGATTSDGRQCPWREAPVVDPDTGDLDYGLFCAEHANPSIGMRNFDNILYAWLAIFQIITQTDWVFMAYDTMDGVGSWTLVIFLLMVILGAFFLVNLALAVLYLYFTKERVEQAELAEKAAMREQADMRAVAAQAAQRMSTAPATKAAPQPPLLQYCRNSPQGQAATSPTPDPATVAGGEGGGVAGGEEGLPSWMQADYDSQAVVHAGGGSRAASPMKTVRWGEGDAPAETPAITAADMDVAGALGGAPYELEPRQVVASAEGGKPVQPVKEAMEGPINRPNYVPIRPVGTALAAWHAPSRRVVVLDSPPERLPTPSPDVVSTTQLVVVQHSLARRVRRRLRRVAMSRKFELFTALVIVANAVVMALTWYGMPDKLNEATTYINYVFSVYFGIEMVIKVWGLGVSRYCHEGMNLFDAVVTVAGLVEMGIDLSPTAGSMGSYLSILRAFRLLRVLRLARSWKSLNRIIKISLRAFSAVAWLTALLALAMFIGALLGMQFFGYQLAECGVEGAQQVCPPGLDKLTDCPGVWDCYVACEVAQEGAWFNVEGSPYGGRAYCEGFPRGADAGAEGVEYWAQVGRAGQPRANFNTFLQAFVTIFQIITLDNWSDSLHNAMALTTPAAALFYVVVIVVGVYIILNLFLAILLDSLDQVDENAPATLSTMSVADSVASNRGGGGGGWGWDGKGEGEAGDMPSLELAAALGAGGKGGVLEVGGKRGGEQGGAGGM